ncbi:VOC family protein [Comamonas composti]|uniref:VOC family protein n=1 Tax=Comamonas composti TaxID=408558 RepID=UPI0004210490|nr:VOC family protein [Comamonas composti]
MQIQPYLFFDGRCEEALQFYGAALGAQVTACLRFKDAPADPEPEAGGCGPAPDPEKIMHANLQIGETQIMASDGMAAGRPEFKGISLSISASSDAEAERIFDALAAGGEIRMPLGPTFFATCFGLVTDRFGVSWMVIMPRPEIG